MQTVLFLCTSPLHSLWALGLSAGPYAGDRCVLWTYGGQDFIAEAARLRADSPFAEVRMLADAYRKNQHSSRGIRKALDDFRTGGCELAPDLIVVGNDRRKEFQALAHALPKTPVAYMDDGTGSYAPAPRRVGTANRWLRRMLRRMKYGFSCDLPDWKGASVRVELAWVAFPEHVHAELARKRVHAIDPAWLRRRPVIEICGEAMRLAGLDPAALTQCEQLLVLPLEGQLDTIDGLRTRIDSLVGQTLDYGGHLAIKRHPRSTECSLAFPDRGMIVEVPQRLPLEVMVPLLDRIQVVGTLSTALIYLHWMNPRVRVTAISTTLAPDHPVLTLYRKLGIRFL